MDSRAYKNLILTLLFATPVAYATDLTMAVKDKDTTSFTIENLREFPQKTFKVIDPHEKIDAYYEGVPLKNLLQKSFSDLWKTYDLIYFVASDGFKSAVPKDYVLKNEAVLSLKRKDAQGHDLKFKVNVPEQNEREVELGPTYLVWENINNKDARADEGIYWPYKVVRIELWNYKDKFQKSVPADKSPQSVKKGFAHFQRYCMVCHSVNGEGGVKGGDLKLLTRVPGHNETWLRQWLDNPQKMNPKTTMPALEHNLKDRNSLIEELDSYLRQ